MNPADLIQELRDEAAEFLNSARTADNGFNAEMDEATSRLLSRAADFLASKDTAIAEIRAELAEARTSWRQAVDLYEMEVARVDPALAALKEATARATAAESELARVSKALERIETVAKDRSEKAWFRLDSIADEAHYAILPRAASRSISQDGEERSK